jgi:hypothetical protein
MDDITPATIEHFMRGQVQCWNAHDKSGMLAHYRAVAAQNLVIEYVGRDEQADGWLVIEEMYDKHNAQFRLEVVTTIINGNEAAAHHRNCIIGTDLVIESIETYRFTPGGLHVRYFLKPPETCTSASAVDLTQFRGFAPAATVATAAP